MKFKSLLKTTLVGMAMGSTLLMSGCSTIPEPTKVVWKCKANSEGLIECELVATWKNESGNYNNLAQLINENLALDFSNSPNALLANQFSVGNITLTSNGLPIATQTSTYEKSGQTIVAADNNDMGSWLASYDGQADEITLTIGQLTFESVIGTNTVVVEFTHNGNVFAGAATSEYISPFSPEALQIGYQ